MTTKKLSNASKLNNDFKYKSKILLNRYIEDNNKLRNDIKYFENNKSFFKKAGAKRKLFVKEAIIIKNINALEMLKKRLVKNKIKQDIEKEKEKKDKKEKKVKKVYKERKKILFENKYIEQSFNLENLNKFNVSNCELLNCIKDGTLSNYDIFSDNDNFEYLNDEDEDISIYYKKFPIYYDKDINIKGIWQLPLRRRVSIINIY